MSSEPERRKPKQDYTKKAKPSMIREVYINNLKEELLKIALLIDLFPIISLDTEFPGCIYTRDTHPLVSDYKLVKKNVDALKPIQIGLTLSDKQGNLPNETCTWQFNLYFNIEKDLCQKQSIDFLHSSGIDFEQHRSRGIPHLLLGEYLIGSGLFLNCDVEWVTFHGIYDFAYLLKVVTNLQMPDDEAAFHEDLKLYFRNYYDLRYLIEFTDLYCGSLNRLAKDCGVIRIGTQHQAGSDSLVTAEAFEKIREFFAQLGQSVDRYKNKLFKYEKDEEIIRRFQPYVSGNYYCGNQIPYSPNVSNPGMIYYQGLYQNGIQLNSMNQRMFNLDDKKENLED